MDVPYDQVDLAKRVLRIPITTCRYVLQLPFEEQCQFVLRTADCSFDGFHLIKPYSWIFCAGSQGLGVLGIFGMFLTLILLFISISIVADAFVCPNVAVMAAVLHMSENIAGVTILAFGNGAPDLFTSLAGAEMDHPEILYAGMTGSALFVSTLAAGIVIAVRPFHLKAWPFFINVSFLLLAYSVLFLSYYTRSYELPQAIALMCIYVVYIGVAVLDSVITEKYDRASLPEVQIKDEAELRRLAAGYAAYIPPEVKYRASVAVEILKGLERNKIYKDMGYRPSIAKQRGNSWRQLPPLFKEFITAMKPIDPIDWYESKLIGKIYMILEATIKFCVRIIVPVVNVDSPNDGWCKLLMMINMLIFPSFVLFATEYLSVMVGGVPLWAVAVSLGLVAASVVFFATEAFAAPRYHNALAFLGFVQSILLIRLLAGEVIIHLQTLGARFNLSSPLLALTLLSFGNSVGDLVISYGLAKQGMQNMGLAACFGGPMFNCSFGVSLISMIISYTGHELVDFYGELSPAASLYLFISLCSSLIFLSLQNFQARTSYGLYLIVLYLVYVFLLVMMEFVIHPFGTQHFRKKRDHN